MSVWIMKIKISVLIFICVILYSQTDNDVIYMDFRNFESCKYKGLKATFKRVSTPSTTSDDDKEPLRTKWLWYWVDQSYVWKLFVIGVEVKYYTNSGWSTRTEKWRSQVQARWVRCFRGNL